MGFLTLVTKLNSVVPFCRNIAKSKIWGTWNILSKRKSTPVDRLETIIQPEELENTSGQWKSQNEPATRLQISQASCMQQAASDDLHGSGVRANVICRFLGVKASLRFTSFRFELLQLQQPPAEWHIVKVCRSTYEEPHKVC